MLHDNQRIPVLDLSTEIDSLWGELTAAIHDVLRSGQFIMGEPVKALEQELAGYLGVQHAVAVNSGTDALVIALRALGIQPGDEVITTPFTFFATAECISLVGATPVFVDIEPRTYNLDAAQIAGAITPRTRAIIPVHLFGQAADMGAIMALAGQHNLVVLEDVAQAFGGQWRGQLLGTLGQMSAFSFFPSKNLGAYGDGGLVATNDDGLAECASMLRQHGSKKKYHNEILGYNSRLDTLQAAVLRVKLPYLDSWNAARREAAARYDVLLADLPGVTTPAVMIDAHHVYHQYTIRLAGDRRDHVQAAMKSAGVESMIYYPVPVHRLPIYRHLDYRLPQAEAAAREVLSLPIWPQITGEIQERVVYALRKGLENAT
jgi:dTDP-4-amino-4,6-dideoxygalactose transaminase